MSAQDGQAFNAGAIVQGVQQNLARSSGILALIAVLSGGGAVWLAPILVVVLVGCGSDAPPDPMTDPEQGPAAGNPDGACGVPAEAAAEDVSSPRTVVGTGTPESCTSTAFVAAVAAGGVITFDCGPDPVTIALDETAKIVNDTGPRIVIDGGFAAKALKNQFDQVQML